MGRRQRSFGTQKLSIPQPLPSFIFLNQTFSLGLSRSHWVIVCHYKKCFQHHLLDFEELPASQNSSKGFPNSVKGLGEIPRGEGGLEMLLWGGGAFS